MVELAHSRKAVHQKKKQKSKREREKNPSAGSREGNREDECMITRMINAIGKDDLNRPRKKKNHTFG